jgi:carbon storage regulator
MLVLSRKANQGVCIGDHIHITVLSIERGRVKLGIEAPEEVRVDRDELRSPHRQEA